MTRRARPPRPVTPAVSRLVAVVERIFGEVEVVAVHRQPRTEQPALPLTSRKSRPRRGTGFSDQPES